MPPVGTLPQDKPFDMSQINNMTQSISNLFKTVDNQRVRNQERNIQNIISSVNPLDVATGKAKSPLQINQEITSKINLDRQQRGKPGLLDMFNQNILPNQLAPTERALQQSGLNLLLNNQASQRAEEDRTRRFEREDVALEASQFGLGQAKAKGVTPEEVQEGRAFDKRVRNLGFDASLFGHTQAIAKGTTKERVAQEREDKKKATDLGLESAQFNFDQAKAKGTTADIVKAERELEKRQAEANITATEALGTSRLAKDKGITPTAEVNLVQDLVSNTENRPIIDGLTGAKASILGLNIPTEKKNQLINSFLGNFSEEEQADMIEMDEIVTNNLSLDRMMSGNRGVVKIIDTGLNNFGRGVGTRAELKNLSEDEGAKNNIKFNVLQQLDVSHGSISNNLLALREEIKGADLDNRWKKDEDDINKIDDYKREDAALDLISEDFSFEDDNRENKIADGDEDVYDKLNHLLLGTLKQSKDLENYKEKYLLFLKTLEGQSDVELFLDTLINKNKE